jgi:N-acetylglucosaminyldiphosphoundecaprenol N-acetyl-beta-D-mannosaminyltransferase
VKSIEILGVRIDDVSRQQLVEKFVRFLNSDKFSHISTVNPEFLVEASRNLKFREILNKTSLNVCDGVGISLLSRLFYSQSINRITGVETAEILCQVCEKEEKSVYLIGGFGVAKKAAQSLSKKYPKLKIAGYEDGNPAKLSEKLIKSKPDVVLVAFGAPKQEIWLQTFANDIPSIKIGIGIGGTFDFWAGKVKRAPLFIQKIGVEWLWRLFHEPIKRGKRILKAVFVFPYFVIREKFFK